LAVSLTELGANGFKKYLYNEKKSGIRMEWEYKLCLSFNNSLAKSPLMFFAFLMRGKKHNE
jgi:hypothetical protein